MPSIQEEEILKIIPHVIQSAQKKIWVDYDEAADVMYINFKYPPNAVEHEQMPNGIVRNYDEKGKFTGFTIIVARRFLKQQVPVAVLR